MIASLGSGCASVPRHPTAPDLPAEANQACDEIPSFVIPENAAKIAAELETRCAFHMLAVNPKKTVQLLAESALSVGDARDALANTPLFLVGFEKPRNPAGLKHCIDDESEKPGADCFALKNIAIEQGYEKESQTRARSTIRSELNDKRATALTHISKFNGFQNGSFREPCFSFNYYKQGDSCSAQRTSADINSESLPKKAELAIRDLQSLLRTEISTHKPTHVLILSTGWNTAEFESLYNYRDWMYKFQEAANNAKLTPEQFRPLYIGVAWESKWQKAPASASPITKGNDADELGYSWMNKVLNEAILPEVKNAATKPKTIAIGHSYGARILGNAIFTKALISHRKLSSDANVDLFIGLQSAFPIRRMTYAGKEPTWAHYLSTGVPVALFSSEFDAATSLSVAPTYAGGKQALAFARENLSWITLRAADENGVLTAVNSPKAVTVIDASAFVKSEMPGTKGGAHSDVFDIEMATAIMQLIRER